MINNTINDIIYGEVNIEKLYISNILNGQLTLDFVQANKDIFYKNELPDIITLDLEPLEDEYSAVQVIEDPYANMLMSDQFIIESDTSGNGFIDGYLVSFNSKPEIGTVNLYHNEILIKTARSNTDGYFKISNLNESLTYKVETLIDNNIFDGKVRYNTTTNGSIKVPYFAVLEAREAFPKTLVNSNLFYRVKVGNYDGTIELSMVPDYGWSISRNEDTFTLTGLPVLESGKFEFVFSIRLINRFTDKEDQVYEYQFRHTFVS